jgi:monoamine oxidase
MRIFQVKIPEVQRRKALKNIGAGLSATVALPAWLTACVDNGIRPEVNYDGTVAVIGAGAAGLYAADSLRIKGVKVKVYEAADRVGGRIRSVTLADQSLIETDFPIELGAERIIGSDSIWARFVDELGIPVTTLTAPDGFILDGIFTTSAEAQSDADYLAAKTFLENLSSYGGSAATVQQEIDAAGLNARTKSILNSWIGNKAGSSNDRAGIGALAEAITQRQRNGNERLIKSNPMFSVLTERFNAILPQVQLNTIVKSINYSGSRITISGDKISGSTSESFSDEVDKIVITVPVSIIKNGDITFTPPLPDDKLSALSNIAMDPAIRVVLDFKQNFWGDDLGYIYGGDVAPEYLSTGLNRSEYNKTLSITICGAKAEVLSAKGDGMIDDILAELDLAFGGRASKDIRRDDADKPIYMIRDWSQQTFIKGGMSSVLPGGSVTDREALGTPVGSVLFFAGEATHPSDAGTVNGALLSAERAVVEVVKSIVGA